MPRRRADLSCPLVERILEQSGRELDLPGPRTSGAERRCHGARVLRRLPHQPADEVRGEQVLDGQVHLLGQCLQGRAGAIEPCSGHGIALRP